MIGLPSGIILLGIVFVLLYLLAKYYHEYWKNKGVPQIEPIDLIFGNYKPLLTGQKSLQYFFLDIYKKAKERGYSYLGLYNGLAPTFMPIKIDLVKRILSKDYAYFEGHGIFHHKSDMFTMNLFNLEGKLWKERRNKMTPAFTSGKIKLMFETLTGKSNELLNVIKTVADSNEPVDIKPLLARFTTDVIGNVAFGLNVDTLHNPSDKFWEIGQKIFKPSMIKLGLEMLIPADVLCFFGYQSTPKDIKEYFTKVVLDTIDYRTQNNVKRNDFMQMMIQLNKTGSLEVEPAKTMNRLTLTKEEVITESFLIYLAGFETSSSTMTFAFHELAQEQNHHIQERLRKEILENLKNHNGNLTYEGIMEMEYLDKVIKETLRKFPVVGMLPRICTKDYQIPDTKILIKKGTRVAIPVLGIHLDEEYYPNPQTFNPENFNKDKIASRPDFSWLAFGEGPRQCLGLRFGLLQTKVGIAYLLSKYRFTLDESMKPSDLYEPDKGSFIYTLKNRLMLKVTPI